MKLRVLALASGFFLPGCPAAPEAKPPAPTKDALPQLGGPPSQAPRWLGAPPSSEALRIVTLAPGVTELVFALGAGERVVATSRFADWPPAARDRPKVGGLTDLDVEAVFAAEPDLVVGIFAEAYRSKLETLHGAGISVLLLPSSSVADFAASAQILGEVLGRSAAAKGLVTQLSADLAAAPPPRGNRALRVVVVYGWRPLFVAGPGSFPDELLGFLGAKNVVDEGAAWAQWSYEALVAANPEVVIDATTARGKLPSALTSMSAARSGRIYPAPEGLSRPGPRLGAATRALGQILTATTP